MLGVAGGLFILVGKHIDSTIVRCDCDVGREYVWSLLQAIHCDNADGECGDDTGEGAKRQNNKEAFWE